MPEILSFTDGQFPNSNVLEGYDTFDVFEPDSSIWSRMVPPSKLTIHQGGDVVGELSLGRDRTGFFRFQASTYGVSSRWIASSEYDRDETYYLEAFDIEFEKTFCRSMSHGSVSVVNIFAFEVRQSLISKEQSLGALMRRAAAAAKAPAWKDTDTDKSLICRIFVRKDLEEPDLIILNALLLSDRATWHAIVAR